MHWLEAIATLKDLMQSSEFGAKLAVETLA
jgi:hypothetical protein